MSKTNKIIQGTYSDFKMIKTRSVCQVIIELPLEQAESFISMFGIPQPSQEKWVALAMLNERNIQKNSDVSFAIQKCGILCKEKIFGVFLKESKKLSEINTNDPESITQGLKSILGVKSRTEFHKEENLIAWNRLYSEYEMWVLENETNSK